MTTSTRRFKSVALFVVAAVAALVVWGTIGTEPASAHGKDLDIAVIPLVPDPERPLLRLYRVEVVYLNDREPVEQATVVLRAEQGEGSDTPSAPVELTEVDGEPGIYVGELTFTRFGTWRMQLSVVANLGLGDGTVSFENEIRPGSLNPEQEAALREEAERVIRLQLSFGFDWWPDVVNIVMRVVHSLAGLSYFMLTAVAFGMAWFGVPPGPIDVPGLLKRVFLPVAALSLAALLGAGLYSAAFDAPITSPGIYDVERMRQIPYGEAYLVAFFLKVVGFVVLVALALRIHIVIMRWTRQGAEPSGATVADLRRATMANAAVGLAIVADVAVVVYLHYVSHLGVFIPEA